ncbi:MAG: acylphosphatase [Bacteroidetes bacterium]|nr:acylphosphatase [Bacteroidota bacterium]
MPQLIKHYNIRVFGSVQGVWFRASAKELAGELNINGIAKNEMDGSVYIEAEGSPENLQEFISWCKRGPERALVSKMDYTEAPLKRYNGFRIIR